MSREIITTNAGRSWFKLPRPYATQAPALGRPASCEPVWKNVIAGSWLIASVYIERTMHRSSTILAVCGNRSLTQAPHWPCCWNGKIDGTSGNVDWPEVIVVSRWPMRTEAGSSWPRSSCSFGL